MKIFDVYLSYCSEDDHQVIVPIIMALKKSRLSCFIDFEQMDCGENITAVSLYGIANAQYVLAVITEDFVNTSWSMHELQPVIDEWVCTGQNKLIAVIAGTARQKEYIMESIPQLRNLPRILWRNNPYWIVRSLKRRIINTKASPIYRHT